MKEKTSPNPFVRFCESEQAGGTLLLACTAIALALANSPSGPDYLGFWHLAVAGMSIEHWVNDALMAIFFLLIGLELERELYVGELSDFRNALLPAVAAIGGMVTPALIHFSLNAGTPMQAGIGIPVATDIAFAMGILALLGDRIPASLKVFIVAFAIMDDLGAIVVIAVFYSAPISLGYLAGGLAVWAALIGLNRLHVLSLVPYLLGGALLWFLMLKSGVHATMAGVMLAFAIPFSSRGKDRESPSHTLENFLEKPVAFLVLPAFALANAGVVIPSAWLHGLTDSNSLGIIAGLLIGKPLGIVAFCVAATTAGIGQLPRDVGWAHVVGAGLLGGIGFTMSIFIANLAFAGNPEVINSSKMAILVASFAASLLGYLWFRFFGRPV